MFYLDTKPTERQLHDLIERISPGAPVIDNVKQNLDGTWSCQSHINVVSSKDIILGVYCPDIFFSEKEDAIYHTHFRLLQKVNDFINYHRLSQFCNRIYVLDSQIGGLEGLTSIIKTCMKYDLPIRRLYTTNPNITDPRPGSGSGSIDRIENLEYMNKSGQTFDEMMEVGYQLIHDIIPYTGSNFTRNYIVGKHPMLTSVVNFLQHNHTMKRHELIVCDSIESFILAIEELAKKEGKDY
jgi:hypothetical protein